MVILEHIGIVSLIHTSFDFQMMVELLGVQVKDLDKMGPMEQMDAMELMAQMLSLIHI